jgi:hypothetical protein
MILANYSQINRNTVAQLGNAFTNPFCIFRPNSIHAYYCRDESNTEAIRGNDKSAFNNGYGGGYAWHLSPKAGGLGSCNEIAGTGTLAAGLTRGINIASSLSGSGSIGTPSLSMVVQLAASLAGTGALTASLLASLNLSAGLSGSGSLTGALNILAQLTAALTGSGSVSANLKGKLSLSADIYVNQSEASAEQIATAVWNAVAEGSYTYEEVMRILAAAAAGKTSNTGQTFRDLSDTKDRITGTVSGGNRTAASYDVS